MFMDPSLGVVHLGSTIGQLGSQLGKGKIKSQALNMSPLGWNVKYLSPP